MKINRNTKSIYVIENMDNGRIKIGVSDNPKERIKSLMHQGGCLMTIRYQSHQIENYCNIESNLHAMFVEQRYVGEWFNVSANEAINAVRGMVKNRHDCNIIRKFQRGDAVGEIARLNNVSRTAIVNYLLSKGFTLRGRDSKKKKPKYKPAQPFVESNNLGSSKLEKMVIENNRKISVKRKSNRLK